MRLLLFFLSLLASAVAFLPTVQRQKVTADVTTTQLNLERRDVIMTGILGWITVPGIATAKGSTFFYDDKIEQVREASQMPTGGKLDLNSAFVVRFLCVV